MAQGGAHQPVAAEVAHLANRVAGLRPCHRNPERFHEEKSDIVHELNVLARALEVAR